MFSENLEEILEAETYSAVCGELTQLLEMKSAVKHLTCITLDSLYCMPLPLRIKWTVPLYIYNNNFVLYLLDSALTLPEGIPDITNLFVNVTLVSCRYITMIKFNHDFHFLIGSCSKHKSVQIC